MTAFVMHTWQDCFVLNKTFDTTSQLFAILKQILYTIIFKTPFEEYVLERNFLQIFRDLKILVSKLCILLNT